MASLRLALLLLLTSRAAASQAMAVAPAPRASIAMELAARHSGQLDQTLSPLRYGGGAAAVRLSLELSRGFLDFAADADLAVARLSVDVGPGGSPSMRAVESTAHLSVARRTSWHVAGLLLAPGLRLAGRVAAREHHFTRAQSSNFYDGSIADSYDEILALQPQLRARRALAGGHALSLAVAASAFTIAAHPYFPQNLGSATSWTTSGPAGALLADGSIEFVRSSRARTSVGVRYSVQVVRLRGTSAFAEVSHQLGAGLAWRRGAR